MEWLGSGGTIEGPESGPPAMRGDLFVASPSKRRAGGNPRGASCPWPRLRGCRWQRGRQPPPALGPPCLSPAAPRGWQGVVVEQRPGRTGRTALGLGAGVLLLVPVERKKANSPVSPNPFEIYFNFCVAFLPPRFYILLQAFFCIFISTLKTNRKRAFFCFVCKHKHPLEIFLNIFIYFFFNFSIFHLCLIHSENKYLNIMTALLNSAA